MVAASCASSLLATAIAAVLAAPPFRRSRSRYRKRRWSVRFDNTGKFNHGVRTEGADGRMLATPNNNDGDYSRDAGDTVTARFDLLTVTELDVVNKGQHRLSHQRRQLV